MLSFEKYAKKKGLLCEELENEPDYDEYYSYKENLSFEDYMLITEKLYGNTGWVFHRTKEDPTNSQLFKYGIKHAKNSLASYGTGLYATYDLESQFNTKMSKKYGNYIIKGKINLSNFVILDEDVYKNIHPNLSFLKYIRSLRVSSDDFYETYRMKTKESSAIAAKYWKGFKEKGYNGILFKGRRDGYVAVIWNRKNFIPYSFCHTMVVYDESKGAWVIVPYDETSGIKREDYPEYLKTLKLEWKPIKADYKKILSRKEFAYDKDPEKEKYRFKVLSKSNNVTVDDNDKFKQYFEKNSLDQLIHQLSIEKKINYIIECWYEYDSDNKVVYKKVIKKTNQNGECEEHWYYPNSSGSNGPYPAGKAPNLIKRYRKTDLKTGKVLEDNYPNQWYKEPQNESLSFRNYIFIKEDKVEIPLERAYELFKAEYEKSTGQSWTYEKFLKRAGNWEFYGDMDGFVAIRKQNSGFVKFVGMAGSMKSKYKGFKEVVALGLPLWAMVTNEIADMCKKTGMRSPNALEMFAIKKALLNNPAIMGDAKVLNYLKNGGVEIQYPDIGRTIKYFVATPAYYTKARKMLIKV
jgi:hypothetical protein